MTKLRPRLLLLLLIGGAILVAVIFFPKLNKPKKSTSPKVYSSLFVYEDVINQKEPSFSLKLPDGWYRDLGVKGNQRLLSFSPDKDNKGITYRAFISAAVVPTKLDLTKEVARARKDIGLLAVDHKFTTDKSITVKGYPAHLFEYYSTLKEDSQNVEQTLGKAGLRTHHTDIITVKNGYFIDIAAYTYEWAWPEFVSLIEKSFNTISFNPK